MDKDVRKCRICKKELSTLDNNTLDVCQACRSKIGKAGGLAIKALMYGIIIKLLKGGNKA